MSKHKIKNIPASDRPREKLIKSGAGRLKDEELLAILLRSGYKGKNVIKLAKYFLEKYPLIEFLQLDFEELMKLKGIGSAKAAAIKAVAELCERTSGVNNKAKVKIDNAKDVFAQVANLCNKKQERLVVLFLNVRNELLTKETVTTGTLRANLISPREIFARALDKFASSVVLAHNHPSGDETPSAEDLKVTERLVKAGKIMDILIFDHLVVSKNDYISIRQKFPAIFK